LEKQGNKMPKCYQLVGVPGAGKSTWITNQEWAKDCAYISTDRYVERQAELEGKTYSEVFKDFMPFAVKMMADDVVTAREAGRDIIWDQTSTTIASRTRKFNMLPDYEHIAVVFATPEPAELVMRLDSRYDSGKIIPDQVVQDMINNWEEPTLEEGFEEIWRV
jgi:predicted kinase